jgi:SAM-dependent methyltransferase
MSDYNKKIKNEKEWYNQKNKSRLVTKIFKNPVFWTDKRNSFNYIFPKIQMSKILEKKISQKVDKLLIAPCGIGADLKYVEKYAKEIYGIDISPIAVKQTPAKMKTRIGDILNSGYPEETFDIIVCPLFFHHLLNFSFEPFLMEFYRLLKKNGILIILEPSIFYPMNIITRPIKHLFKNPYGEVEDEGPFNPKLLLNNLRLVGFNNIELNAASFSHCSFYIPLSKIVNIITKPLLNSPFKYCGWLVLFSAEK